LGKCKKNIQIIQKIAKYQSLDVVFNASKKSESFNWQQGCRTVMQFTFLNIERFECCFNKYNIQEKT